MKLPRAIEIDGKQYPVKAKRLRRGRDGSLVLGEYKNGRITVDPRQLSHDIRDTLLHETLHASCAHIRADLTKAEEERAISILTPILLDVLRRNPELVALLTG